MKTLTIPYSEYKNRGVRNAFEYFETKLKEAGFNMDQAIKWSPFDYLCDITFTQPEGIVVEAELALVPMDQLLEEVMKRHDHAIFSGVQKDTYRRRWKGSLLTGIGFAWGLAAQLHDSFTKSQKPL